MKVYTIIETVLDAICVAGIAGIVACCLYDFLRSGKRVADQEDSGNDDI